MSTCKIHQIYYSPESFAALDSGFIPLDNTHGRKDWMEYGAIREYFLNNPVGDDELVGFFSPRFFEKTGLTSNDVYAHIDQNKGNDVYIFNPYFHLAAWYPNIFIQGEVSHTGLIDTLENALRNINISVNLKALTMSSINTVYCNYFVANIKFWKEWLMLCEYIYQVSEMTKEDNSWKLSSQTDYIRGDMPMQIFIIERIASLLLSINNEWKVCNKSTYKSIEYRASKKINGLLEKLWMLDNLKTSYIRTKNQDDLDSYNKEREFLNKKYSLYI